eukprot:NODE_36_length_31474_cov_0.342438.p6 type:complete len:487 gc:universal NODE_36_length_31474_cov_0.342438:13816-12356(-)
MDIGLIVTIPFLCILILIASFYFLVYFMSPDDIWTAWAPKILFILCMTLACFNVLMLPLDVANSSLDEENNGGLPIREIAIVCFLTSICLVYTVIPFCVFWYEGIDDGSGGSQLGHAMKWTIPTIIVILLVFVAAWLWGKKTPIDVSMLVSPMISVADFADIQSGCSQSTCLKYNYTADKDISFVVYIIGISSVIAWVIMAAFGGVGLACLPIDLITSFVEKPKPITVDIYSKNKLAMVSQSMSLIVTATSIQERLREDMSQKVRRKLKLEEAAFRREVMNLENTYKRNEISYRNFGGNALLGYTKFLVGIIGSLLSFMWVLHCCFYLLPSYWNFPPLSPFLNDFFISFDQNDIPFLGTFFYGLFSFWLLMCVMKGNSKLGMRVLFISVHPLKIGATYMNSLIFNIGLILLTSIGVVQFCTKAFDLYASNTAILNIFGSQIGRISGIEYVYSVFIVFFLMFFCLGFLWSTMFKNAELKKMKNNMEA